ncbi:MAG: translocation/assembly module TamB [Bacteroidales bacterium]|nr:translocation/assembly module TamB [Bacteroidales bacterium]MCF8402322.1 translocation/assembly module TamB [Bacteroidales bacterium]
MILRNPLSQTFLARVATSYLTKKLQTEIKIERLEIRSLQRATLGRIMVKDQHGDTLLFADYLSLKFELPVFHREFNTLNEIILKDADIRIRRYLGEENFNLQFIIDFIGKTNSPDTTTGQSEFKLDDLNISSSAFIYQDQNRPKVEEGIDFDDIKISNLNLLAQQIAISGDTLRVDIENASVHEKSGFVLDSLACKFLLHPNALQAEQLKIITAENNLDLDLRFDFNSMLDFNDFISKVRITSSIRPSLINLTEVGYFAPVMFPMDNRLRVSGDISGTVDNFKAKNFRFGAGRYTQFKGNIQINGLPDIEETFSHISVNDFETTIMDIRAFKLPEGEGNIDVPEQLDGFGRIRIKGKFTGFYNDFVSYADFKTDLGQARTDMLLRVSDKKDIEYSGHLEANDFNLGKLFHVEDKIGKLDIFAEVNGYGSTFDNMDITLVGTIDSLEFFRNVYNEIAINGNLQNKKFEGWLDVSDELVSFDFSGSVDYGGLVPAYNFHADIQDAWLYKINLVDHKESANLSTQMDINFIGDNIDNMQGIVSLDSTIYKEDDRQYFMQNLSLSVTRDADKYSLIRLYSDFIDFTLEGNYSLAEMPIRLTQLTDIYFDTLVPEQNLTQLELLDQDFVFNLDLKNTKALSEIFIPELRISPDANITGGYSSKTNYLFFYGTIPELIFSDKQFNLMKIDFETPDENALLGLRANSLYFSDTLNTDKIKLKLKAKNNRIGMDLDWAANEKSETSGNLSGHLKFLGPRSFKFQMDSAKIYFSDSLWTINPENAIWVDSNNVRIDNLRLSSNKQEIFANGKVSENITDTLLIGFSKFDLSNFDVLLQNLDIDLDGIIDGQMSIIDYYHSPFFLADLKIEGLYFNKEKLGRAEISTIWDSKENAFDLNGDIIYTGNVGERKSLDVSGKYYPNREKDNFDIDALFNNYKLSTLEPFLSSFSSDIEGLATGEVHLGGSTFDPDITGQIDLIVKSFLIDYTQVRYSFSDKVIIEPNHIYFKNILVNDTLANNGLISGDIYHNHLRDFNFDITISTSQLLGLNTTRKDNSIFYGQAITSGGVKIFGPLDMLTMDVDVKSEKGTQIKIPISYGTEVGENDYIVFVNNEPKEEEKEKVYKADMTGLALKLNLAVTNDADIQMFMPYGMGNIKARGKGEMKMSITPTSDFTMDGEYAIDRGSFFFTLQNIINRNFEISRGSKVVWTGDPYDAKINLKAVYKVKTTLGEYGPPTDSSTRVPVDCIISLKNRLLDPEIRFSVEFPDLKDDTKQTIYSRLDTTDQAMMSQQMISLLVLNSFMTSEGYSGAVGFNTFSLLTNQLNNWLSQISNDFDVGINYRPGDAVSAREVEVALSTQLFDERVTIDGNVGMRGEQDTQNTNSLVGEVVVEVRITPDGRFRAKAFNKSNNDYLYRNYAPYTQGVGVFYTQEFNRVSDLFQKKNKAEKIEFKKADDR